ncbi:hypothetical protein GQ55_3G463200 [Panicum hallii var. hallii]|uniref:Uncharacterized protein n=1 Tax=Panicum hallii var. hallii TaxID=1504633 RepID=A0A2T7EIY3_9POAL|nr:hypothetical protein GQ55_3G463200 [Panicum hallii var. hallii]
MACRVEELRMIGGWAILDLPSTARSSPASFGPRSEELGVRPRSMGYRRHLHLIRVGERRTGDRFQWLSAAGGGIRFRRIGGAEGPKDLYVILLFARGLSTCYLYPSQMYLYLDGSLHGFLNINTSMF